MHSNEALMKMFAVPDNTLSSDEVGTSLNITYRTSLMTYITYAVVVFHQKVDTQL